MYVSPFIEFYIYMHVCVCVCVCVFLCVILSSRVSVESGVTCIYTYESQYAVLYITHELPSRE